MEFTKDFFWYGWRAGTCLPDCWCEAPRFGSMIVEPVNFWTNISYVYFGFLILMRYKKFANQDFLKNKDFVYLYSLALIFLGIGSGFWHMSLTFFGQWLDLFGMYLVVVFLLGHNALKLKWLNKKGFYLFYISVNLISGVLLYYIPEFRRYLFAIFLVLTIGSTIYTNQISMVKLNLKYFYFSLGSLAIAYFAWNLDHHKVICHPHGWMNGHGIWHLLAGLSCYLIFKFFASEKKS
ncbi:ceramidase [Bacteriovoracaceae bacterium]|nr:ceramidase [Bacteriovoracaceae bacterium]